MTKSFLFSLMVISVLKNSDFYRKVQGRVQAGMMLSVARAIGVKRGIYTVSAMMCPSDSLEALAKGEHSPVC